jgi:glycosyltransferase involved in cell wall biosynthesis
VRLLAAAYLRAQRLEQRLHLVLAGGGPEEEWLRERLGGRATFLGWLEGDDLPRAYANADVFLFPSRTDTFGQVVLEAHASGLPVIAVGEGGPASLVRDDIDGRLCTPRAESLAAALVDLAASAPLRRRLARGAIESARNRTWERALEQLANGYELALADRGGTQRAPSAA